MKVLANKTGRYRVSAFWTFLSLYRVYTNLSSTQSLQNISSEPHSSGENYFFKVYSACKNTNLSFSESGVLNFFQYELYPWHITKDFMNIIFL